MTTDPAYYSVMLLLESNDLGTIGADLFGGEWDESTDGQTLCLDGIGVVSEVPETYEQPAVQILVRGERGARDIDAYRKAKAISDLLLSATLDNVDIGGVQYKGFEESSTLARLGKDDNERFIYSMNFYTYRNR